MATTPLAASASNRARPALQEKANNLPTRQAALERHNLAIIDDRDIEALPLSANINAGPRSHASKHARLQYRQHAERMQRPCHADQPVRAQAGVQVGGPGWTAIGGSARILPGALRH